MLKLVAPDVTRRGAWMESHVEWGPGQHEDGFGVGPHDDVESTEGFAAWIERLSSRPAHFWWILEGETVAGGIVLRGFTNDWVENVGHIGYGVRPSARGRGIATWALRQVLERARDAGMERVLLVCRDENLGSIRTVERCGGVLERIVDDERGRARHYWIRLN